MKLSEKIIKLRKEKGLSQEEFGNKINVSRQAISKWETEQSQPEIEKIKEISKVFSVSIEYLLNDELENDNTKKISKFNKKKFGKCLLKVIIVLIMIYLIYSAYKFIILYKRYKNIQNIADNELYVGWLTNYYEDKITKDKSKSTTHIIRKDNVGTYEMYYEDEVYSICYENKEKGLAILLVYDNEMQEYVYDKEFSIQYSEYSEMPVPYSRKDIYMNDFPEPNVGTYESTLVQILRVSINPTILVNNKQIKYFYRDGYRITKNNEIGEYEEIYKTYTITDEEEITEIFEVNNDVDNYYNRKGEKFKYDMLDDIETAEDLANFYGIEVIIEE